MVRRRLRFLMLLIALPYVVIEGRLWFVQGRLESRLEYVRVARETTTRREAIPAPRGRILDRRGRVLAENVRRYDLYYVHSRLDPVPRRPSIRAIWENTSAREDFESPGHLEQALIPLARPHLSLDAPAWVPETPVELTLEVPARSVAKLRSVLHRRDSRIRPFELHGPEGAQEEPCTVRMFPRRAFRRELTVLQLSRILGEGGDQESLLEKIPAKETGEWMAEERRERLLVADVGLDVVTAIEYHPERFPGIVIRDGWKRRYPVKEPLGTVLGYLQRIQDPGRLEAEGRLLEKADVLGPSQFALIREDLVSLRDRVGATGLEAQYDSRLRGLYGMCWYPLDPSYRRAGEDFVRLLEIPGEDLRTTLDAELQILIHDQLAGVCYPRGPCEAGSAVVMDLADGAILASASYPSFDPNRIREVGYRRERNQRFRDPHDPHPDPERRRVIPWESHRPLVQSIYPGSVFKIVTALAALERRGPARGIDPHRTFTCGGKYKQYPYWCHLRTGHGPMDLREALERSCNNYFYSVAEELLAPTDLAAIHDWAEALGYGRHPGIDLPPPPDSIDGIGYQARGALTDPSPVRWTTGSRSLTDQLLPLPWWLASIAPVTPSLQEIHLSQPPLALAVRQVLDPPSNHYSQRHAELRQQLNKATICQYAIGQVFVEATPLQVLRSAAAVALRGERLPRPYLVEPSAPDPFLPPLREGRSAVGESSWNAVWDGMRAAARHGTAAKNGLQNLDIAAKTGTAQFREPSASGNLYHAWIAGFGPTSDPRYAFVVCLEKSPDGGGKACAPILFEILKHLARECPAIDPEGRLGTTRDLGGGGW